MKICYKMCTNEKKKGMCKRTCKQSRRKRITSRKTIKKVVRKRQTEEKEGEVQQSCRSDEEKKTKRGTKGWEMKKVMEMKTDKNLNKGGEETRKGGDRKGSRVNGINTHRSVQKSGFVARGNISNFPINLIHSLSVAEVNLSRMSLKATRPCLSGENAYLSGRQTTH